MTRLVDRINQETMTFFPIFDYTGQNKSGDSGIEKVGGDPPQHTHIHTDFLEK